MDRREFLRKSGAGLVGIIAAGRAPAAVVKGMLGAAGERYTIADESDFPYVTNGLIAMYDGEWNAGGGIHSEYITSVVDIAGRNKLEIVGSVYAESNRFHFDGGYASIIKTGIIAKQVEIVFENLGGERFVYDIGGIGGRQACIVRSTQRVFSIGNPGSTDSQIITYNGDRIECYSFSRENQLLYQNGIPISSTLGATYSTKVNGIYLGVRSTNLSWIKKMYLYSVRVYDRNLTDQEVAANYLVDKARFGL